MLFRKIIGRVIVTVVAMFAAVVVVAAPAHATACQGGGTSCLYYYTTYRFQTQSQPYNCGPASTRLALTALGYYYDQGHANDPVSSGTLAGMLRTTTNGTNDISYVTNALNTLGHTSWYASKYITYPVPTSQLTLLKNDVYFDITRGHVIVANVLGHEYDDAGHYHSYSTGHYLTVTGFTQDGADVLIEDVAISANDRLVTNGQPVGPEQYWMSAAHLADWIANKGYSA